jgi:hypothetical protein
MNIGGQLMPKQVVETLIKSIHSGKIKSWEEVHGFYSKQGELYGEQKLQHAFASLLEVLNLSSSKLDKKKLRELLKQAVAIREWMVKGIYDSREKDYTNQFRQMVYDSKKEMEQVLGKLDDNTFINQQQEELRSFRKQVNNLVKLFKL